MSFITCVFQTSETPQSAGSYGMLQSSWADTRGPCNLTLKKKNLLSAISLTKCKVIEVEVEVVVEVWTFKC